MSTPAYEIPEVPISEIKLAEQENIGYFVEDGKRIFVDNLGQVWDASKRHHYPTCGHHREKNRQLIAITYWWTVHKQNIDMLNDDQQNILAQAGDPYLYDRGTVHIQHVYNKMYQIHRMLIFLLHPE